MTVRELIQRLEILASSRSKVVILTDDDTFTLSDVTLGHEMKVCYLIAVPEVAK